MLTFQIMHHSLRGEYSTEENIMFVIGLSFAQRGI